MKQMGIKMKIWFEDRPFIKYGYRINFNTAWEIARSALWLHNESLNFWTHFLSAIWILFELINLVSLTFKLEDDLSKREKIFIKPKNLGFVISG